MRQSHSRAVDGLARHFRWKNVLNYLKSNIKSDFVLTYITLKRVKQEEEMRRTFMKCLPCHLLTPHQKSASY